MSFLKVSTLTSGVLAIAKDIKKCEQESLDINIVKIDPTNKENILVVDVDCNKVSDYDQIVKSIRSAGFDVVISDFFTPIFTVKATNQGVIPISISTKFLSKIIDFSKQSELKLFIDFNGQELMIVNTGEKEFFTLNDYCKENYDNATDDFENLYSVWDKIDKIYKEEEIYTYAIG